MNISHFLKYCLGLFSFLCLFACQTNTVYYTYEPVSTKGWNKTDTLQFYLPDSVALGTYQLEIGIRHMGKYPYRDIWLELTQYIPNPTSLNDWVEKKDTIHIYLANKKGIWNGTGTTSGHFQLLTPVGEITIEGNNKMPENTDIEDEDTVIKSVTKQLPLNQPYLKDNRKKYTFEGKPHRLGKTANHHLKVVHIMTDSILFHISDVGLRLSIKE